MASFSYQHLPILVDSVFTANNNNNNNNNNSGMTKNISGLSLDHQIHEGNIISYTNNHNNSSTYCFSQFHYPVMSDQLAHQQTLQSSVHGVPVNDDHVYTTSNTGSKISLSSDVDNEPSSVTKKQSTDSSTVVDKLEISSGDDEQVTQKLALPMEKKRKTRNGSSSNSSQSKVARETSCRGKKQKSGKSNSPMKDDGINIKEENKVKLNNGKNDEAKNDKGQEEPPSGYIHVRARRGQATDSHSLAERVRREKISERMKMLQRLVPGCEKVTGKALMLDEIINYVQSLQNQVEFLSMRLASLNPMFYDFGTDIDAFLVRPEGLNTLASQIQSVPQCSQSQPTAFTTENNTNNYPTLLDNSASILVQQGQRPIAFSHENGSLLWDMEDQRQSFLNPSGFSNLCSFN